MTKTLSNPPTKIISLLPFNDNSQSSSSQSLSAPVDINCPTMITPITPILTSGNVRLYGRSNEQVILSLGQHFNSVQWTKLSCPSPTNHHSLEPLDTTYVSNVVRKILAQHNIGQRVFAKFILSLSQGTVSELLSKPKPWSKLTEKGKESYRKMWTWANSEESILALKSVSPRKGQYWSVVVSMKNNRIRSIGSKETPQQKSLPILSEPLKTSRSPSTSSVSSRAPSPLEQPSFLPPNMFSSFVPSLLTQTTQRLANESYSPYSLLCAQPDNYRNWLMLQEIFRNNASMEQLKNMDNNDSEQENDHEDEGEEEEEEIPLDLSMKNDSDPISVNKSFAIKSNKAILLPLNEQELTKYRSINTLDLVQLIKDILSRFSISQRHFGEKILGLSQGSVSDILARPKPWELLTQKGREPFIRMRLFLDDDNAMKQLIQSVSLTPPPSILNSSNQMISNENSLDESIHDHPQVLSHDILSSSSTNGTTMNTNKSRSRSKTNQIRTPVIKKTQILPYELPKIPLPTSIDTEQLSSQVRELLSSYSIGQRVFGMIFLLRTNPISILSIQVKLYSTFHKVPSVKYSPNHDHGLL